MLKKTCKHCGIESDYVNFQSFGAHVVNCKCNPKLAHNQELAKKRAKDVNVNKSKRDRCLCCPKCGKEHVQQVTDNNYNKGKYTKYCSRACANARVHSVETKEKISRTVNDTLGKHNVPYIPKVKREKKNILLPNCLVCEKTVKNKNNKYCSINCRSVCPDLKHKISANRKDFLQDNPHLHPNILCANIHESYPERMIREYFEQNGLVEGTDFIKQYKFLNYYIDFYFPKLNLAIEVDGERWHDPTSEKEIKRESLIVEKMNLERLLAKKILKKEYENMLLNIINKTKSSI